MTSDLNGPATFADDGRTVIEQPVKIHSVRHDNIQDIYEIERTIHKILEGNYEKIAIQFPDELLADSTAVANQLRDRTGKRFYILADTSYGSCCVDEVAAEHVGADLIIHYGRSCLSPTSRLPVLYVFGRQPIDIEHCVQEFDALIHDKNQSVIVMCDVVYAHVADTLIARLRQIHNYVNLIPTEIQTESNLQNTLGSDVLSHPPMQPTQKPAVEATSCGDDCSCGAHDGACAQPRPISTSTSPQRTRGGRHYDLPEGMKLEDCSIFYVGGESLTLTNIVMTHSKCKVYTYNPETKDARQETLQVNRMLMKRYYLVQKAKDADVIGIVVGTLGVASYMTIIDHLKRLIRGAGKKSYTFVMGKLNVAKMANFMEIDCYVLVACPENSLIDSKEFYRPIVTPFELEIAISKSKEWTGDYITDFQQLLPGIRTDVIVYGDEENDGHSSDDEPHYSLVTGKYKQGRLYAKRSSTNDELASRVTDLTLRNQNTSISTMLNSAAGEYLRNRSYQGLVQAIGETEASEVEEGRAGIARGYDDEKKFIGDVGNV